MNTTNSASQQPKQTWDTRLNKFQDSAKKELSEIAEGTGKIVVLDFIVGFLMIFFTVSIAGLPLATLAVSTLVFIRLFNKTNYSFPQSSIFIAVMLVALLYISIVSFTAGYVSPDQSLRRLFRIAVIILFALLIADRRIDLRSLLMGLSIAMLVNAVAFYAGLAPDNYGGYLTGWLGDKNVAGLYHAVVPLLVFVVFTKKWHRITTIIVAIPLLWLTGSRTSIAGFMIGVLWFLFAQKLNLFFKALLGIFVVWFFEWLQNTFADSAIFGDRTGTDQFRELIDEAAYAKVQAAPWHGMGLGEATIVLPNGRGQYFHNSFWTLLVEGGWPWLIMICGMTLLAVFVWKQNDHTQRALGAEAVIVVLAVCSWRLGEVILTAPWALGVGLAMSYLAVPKTHQDVSSANRQQRKLPQHT